MNKAKNAERADIKERVCKALDIVPDSVFKDGTVEIRGRNSVMIREGGRILHYSDELVSIEYGKGRVEVKGKRLCCSAYYRGVVRVDGLIRSVELWGTKK